MSIRDYEGETFVAFLDICGFRSMLDNPGSAEETLDDFFRVVYEEVGYSRERPEVVDCVAVSDCAIAFARTENSENDGPAGTQRTVIETNRLKSLLIFTKNVARAMIQRKVAIRGSIAFGSLVYRYTYGGPGRVKAKFLGKAYVDAYLDAEKGLPELRLGEIRSRSKEKIRNMLDADPEMSLQFPLHLHRGGYYTFYWMLDSLRQRRKYEAKLKDCYRQLYDPIISIIKEQAENRTRTK